MDTTENSDTQLPLSNFEILLKKFKLVYSDNQRQRDLVFRFVVFISGCIYLAYYGRYVESSLASYLFVVIEFLRMDNIIKNFFMDGISYAIADTRYVVNGLVNKVDQESKIKPTQPKQEVAH